MYVLIFLLWLVLNGKITLELVLLGLALTALLALVMRALFGYRVKTELRFWRASGLFAAYAAVLLAAVIWANFQVLGRILRGSRALSPALVRIRVPLRTPLCRYLFANSITLTPGTITVDVEDGVYTVHCLDPAMLDGMEDSVFVRLLRRLEG